jgi:hypothetical protein
MANKEHLKILKQGVEKWNEWRKENREIKVDLSYADFIKANFSGIDLSYANLRNAKLIETDLSYANLSNADLSNADLSNADLSKASLSKASLSNANLFNADLFNANLRNANLRNANLIEASLIEANLIEANLSGATVGSIVFGDVDLSETKGLEEIKHSYPSTIGIDTIYKSKGKIPDVFLRKAGVPEDLITYLPSLMGKAVDYYACFISFTEKDDQFSERLYNDLLANGVRCWRWKEDAKWGKTLMKSIDEAVRTYDKLVVICSEQSLQSPAVIREIERALQKEDELARQGKDDEVLFPVRLDDYIFANWQHYRKADVLSKNVGDFRNWTDPDAYNKCLNRLLRDLKPESSES